MLKFVQHLIKSRPNSLSLGKSWEVALVSLVPQGFKIPLQSEDTALFQRDWDLCFSFNSKAMPKSEDTALFQRDWDFLANVIGEPQFVGRHCPVPKGLRLLLLSTEIWLISRKTLPCSKGIETHMSELNSEFTFVGRHCPVPKGLRQYLT